MYYNMKTYTITHTHIILYSYIYIYMLVVVVCSYILDVGFAQPQKSAQLGPHGCREDHRGSLSLAGWRHGRRQGDDG